ncbi:MAG: aminotransferase class I/II-fold pyridoxal phosphate-dependent enzyme [Planctomycetota bacterium]
MDFHPLLLSTEDYPTVALGKLKEARLAKGLPVYDFGAGDPLIEVEPFLNEALIKALPKIPQYPTAKGEKYLLEAIQGYLKRVVNVSLELDQIIPTGGSKEAIYHMAPMLLHAGAKRRGIIYPDPGYPIYASSATFHGGVHYPQPTREETGYQMDLSILPEKILKDSAIAWICNPHNPTGAVGDLSWLKRQVEVARNHDILLCVDECYLEITPERRAPSVLEVAKEGVLAVHSLSKRSGFTAHRSGFIAGDRKVVSLLGKIRPHMGVASPVFVQAMAAAAWKDDAHVQRRLKAFNERRELASAFLDRHGFSYCGKDATFYLWIKMPSSCSYDEKEYCRRLFEGAGILASPGPFYGAEGRGHFRLALVPDMNGTQEALAAWERLIKKGDLI